MAAPKKKTGRPSSFRPEFIEQAKKLCELGATDEEVADFFGVNVRTLYRWNQENEAFSQALKAGKAPADERVERSLFHKAVGYKHEAVKIFMPAGAVVPVYAPYVEHVAPDTTACIFWLKNRRPDLWRDVTKAEVSGPNGGPIQTAGTPDLGNLNPEQRSQLREILKAAGAAPAKPGS